MQGPKTDITIGVDAHLDTHVAVALDSEGRLLSTTSIPTTGDGYSQFVSWAAQLGDITQVGIEGTATFGAGLARHLAGLGVHVIDVDQPDRRLRRTRGKTDAIDAEIAARAVLNGSQRTIAKSANGDVESLRTLRIARRSALKARTQAANQIRSLLVTAPEELRSGLRSLSLDRLITSASAWRHVAPQTTTAATKLALRALARRYQALTAEITDLDRDIRVLTARVAPELLALRGVGPDTAAALLIAAGDNPERLRSESSFAHLCGVAPLPVSSGKKRRHRLNRGGNRDANRALYTIVLGRMRLDERTRAYVARRTAEGLSKRDIMRCLKRYVVRDVFRVLRGASSPLA
ncbi:MAG: IS110 family transposase [Candidatus Dormibacteraeota bacterium]|uniref:IS110 family transposase n=2 Tax=Candidatus Aeolococcus gillhamiae TaxID=3127015 RepID=A0A934JR59_9BACT|nr:IS110 family transposase [Candidatus Dormibacteraeota bacterium]